jgi:hypothetical protein
MPWKLIEFIWRRKNDDDWWTEILLALARVQISLNDHGANTESRSLLTEMVLVDESGDVQDEGAQLNHFCSCFILIVLIDPSDHEHRTQRRRLNYEWESSDESTSDSSDSDNDSDYEE